MIGIVIVGIYTTLVHQEQQHGHGHGQNCDVLNALSSLLLLHLFLCSASASMAGQVMFAFQSSHHFFAIHVLLVVILFVEE